MASVFLAQSGQGDFFAVEDPAPAGESDVFAVGTSTGDGDDFFDGGASGVATVDEATCASLNSQLYITTAAVDGGAVLLFSLFYGVALKRMWMSKWSTLARFFAILTPFAAIAGGIMSQVRWRSETYERCMASAEQQSVLVLPGIEPWVQGLVLGGVVTIVVAFVVQLLIGLIRR